MKKEKKEKSEKKVTSVPKPKKGSNWKSMKTLILKNPTESKQKSLREENPEKSVSSKTITKLEDLLNPDGLGTRALTPVIAIDCEMVGVGIKNESALARVSVVNSYGALLYDTFVKPPSKVTDYRTEFSGIRAEDLEGDRVVSLREAQEKVVRLMKNRIVVGHSISNDFAVLMLHHPRRLIRDTATYEPLMYTNSLGKKKPQKLSILFEKEYGSQIQTGEHDSIDDARATLLIYKKHRIEWENSLSNKNKKTSKDKQ